MQIQTVIDDQLYQQAAELTGLTDKQTLLEEALRLLIQNKKQLLQNKIQQEEQNQAIPAPSTFSAVSLKTQDFQFNRDEANAR